MMAGSDLQPLSLFKLRSIQEGTFAVLQPAGAHAVELMDAKDHIYVAPTSAPTPAPTTMPTAAPTPAPSPPLAPSPPPSPPPPPRPPPPPPNAPFNFMSGGRRLLQGEANAAFIELEVYAPMEDATAVAAALEDAIEDGTLATSIAMYGGPILNLIRLEGGMELVEPEIPTPEPTTPPPSTTPAPTDARQPEPVSPVIEPTLESLTTTAAPNEPAVTTSAPSALTTGTTVSAVPAATPVSTEVDQDQDAVSVPASSALPTETTASDVTEAVPLTPSTTTAAPELTTAPVPIEDGQAGTGQATEEPFDPTNPFDGPARNPMNAPETEVETPVATLPQGVNTGRELVLEEDEPEGSIRAAATPSAATDGTTTQGGAVSAPTRENPETIGIEDSSDGDKFPRHVWVWALVGGVVVALAAVIMLSLFAVYRSRKRAAIVYRMKTETPGGATPRPREDDPEIGVAPGDGQPPALRVDSAMDNSGRSTPVRSSFEPSCGGADGRLRLPHLKEHEERISRLGLPQTGTGIATVSVDGTGASAVSQAGTSSSRPGTPGGDHLPGCPTQRMK